MTASRRLVAASAVLAVSIVAGCGPASGPRSARDLAELKPANPRVAELYAHSCKACHAHPGSGAPLVHDRAAWDPRWAKGEDVLLNHAVLGFQAMPAGGQCATCTPHDFQAIIRFMADKE